MRQKIEVPEENGLLEQLKKTEVGQILALKEKRLIMAVAEGKIEGTCFPGRWRPVRIDDVRLWTEGRLPAASQIALDR